MKNKPGKFIIVEGGEGAGKSTQIRLLQNFLNSEGFSVTVTREPGGTPLAEKLRDIIKGHSEDSEPMDSLTELMLISAARRQHVSQVIEPALARGEIVICDRFHLSTLAYQGYGRGIDLDLVRDMNKKAMGNTFPDILLFLDVPPNIGMSRAKERGPQDRIEKSGDDFMSRVYHGLVKEYRAFSGEKSNIDASNSIESISAEIARSVSRHLTDLEAKSLQLD